MTAVIKRTTTKVTKKLKPHLGLIGWIGFISGLVIVYGHLDQIRLNLIGQKSTLSFVLAALFGGLVWTLYGIAQRSTQMTMLYLLLFTAAIGLCISWFFSIQDIITFFTTIKDMII